MPSPPSTPASTSSETWAAILAALGSAALIAKKLLARWRPPRPDYITRAEFHHQLSALRDRIEATHISITDKLDANHRELLAAVDRQVARINTLETATARLDERTRL